MLDSPEPGHFENLLISEVVWITGEKKNDTIPGCEHFVQVMRLTAQFFFPKNPEFILNLDEVI